MITSTGILGVWERNLLPFANHNHVSEAIERVLKAMMSLTF